MCDSGPQTTTETNPPSLADIVREMTDNGRLIVRVLIDIALGQGNEIKICHQLEATRQLAALGIKLPQVVVNAAAKPAKPRTKSAASTRTAPAGKTNELAEIVKLETDNGKDVVRFLVDVVCDRVADAKMCHRIAAAKELLRHCSGNILVYSDDGEERDESFDDGDQATGPSDPDSLTYVDRRGTVLNKDHAPFDFDHYDREDYKRDRMGHRAMVHIFGSEEAREVAGDAVREFWRDAPAGGHIYDFNSSPIENPEDDPYGKGCYGYKVLSIAFQHNGAIRAANKAVAEYHKRKFKHLINEDGSLAAPADTASLDPHTLQYLERNRQLLAEENGKPPVGPDPPSSVTPERANDPDPSSSITPERANDPPVGAGFKPARGLARPSTGRESETGQPSEDPDPPSPVPPEQPQKPPVGAGFKPARGLTHPSTERHSDPSSSVILSEVEGPPGRRRRRKRPRKIHLGPPDEEPPDDTPRQRRDPGEIRIPLRNLLSITANPL